MSAKDKIIRKLNYMQKYVGYLKSVRNTDMKTLENNYELRSSVERIFHLAIETAIDIGEIIISEEGYERPEDYRSVFLIIGRQGILPSPIMQQKEMGYDSPSSLSFFSVGLPFSQPRRS